MLSSLAFILVQDVAAAFSKLMKTMPEQAAPVLKYLEKHYILGVPLRQLTHGSVLQRPPMFTITLWNVLDRFDSDMPITATFRKHGITVSTFLPL